MDLAKIISKPIEKHYAITVSPKYRAQFYRNYDLYKQDLHIIYNLLQTCSKHFRIVPEFAFNEDTLEHRLHYHGIIRIDDFIAFTKKSIKKKLQQIGFIKLDKLKTFKDLLNYNIYMHKDLDTTRSINKHIIPMNYFKKTRITKYRKENNKPEYSTVRWYFKHVAFPPQDQPIHPANRRGAVEGILQYMGDKQK